jgi:hypothetical protein
MRRILLLAVLAALALSAPAGAAIVPGQSIAGVELEMTQGQVIGVLGTPARIQHGTNEFGSYTVFRYRKLVVTFQGNASVTAVKTTRRAERTPHGVHVGSTRAQLKAGVNHLRCDTKWLCRKGRLLPGHRVTVFRLYQGRVTSILVGFVID